MPSSRTIVALCALSLASHSLAFAAPVYQALTHPSLAGHLPGADGLIGTADDLISPGANPSGAVSFTEFSGTALGDFVSFSEGTLTITQPLVVDDRAVILVERFDVDLFVRATTGYDSLAFDLPTGPHQIVTELPFLQSTRFTQAICLFVFGCDPEAPLPHVEFDIALDGFTYSVGYDPSAFPGVDPTLAAYVGSLIALAPPNWTAVAVGVGSQALTPENTRGPAAGYFLGGQARGAAVWATTDTLVLVPEVSSLWLTATGVAALALLRVQPRRSAGATGQTLARAGAAGPRL